MKKIICKNYEEMSKEAAAIIAAQLCAKPKSVIGFATGSTPVGTYEQLRVLYDQGSLSFSQARAFNLDEYYPIARENDQSYHYFMRNQLFNHIDILPGNTDIPNGEAADPKAECARYDEALAAAGGTDIQIVGIGRTGHIGFNEPAEVLPLGTNLVELTQKTIDDNARFFASAGDVPRKALTMGMGGICASKHILLLISGKEKAEIAKELFSGKLSTQNPSTLLSLHPNVTVLIDEEAASFL